MCKLLNFRLYASKLVSHITKVEKRNQRCIFSNINHKRPYSCHSITNMSNSVFTGSLDRFNGITVDSLSEKCSVEDFTAKLQESLKVWAKSTIRGVWFKINLQQTDWVPELAKNGFKFHHAQNDFVMMYKWLPQCETSNIPPYAHTMIGVGAVVINENADILVVNEKYYKVPHWKLPGGYVEPGENLIDAAIREVYEETKIHTEYISLLSLRHAHRGMFNCSDIYVVINLKPLSSEIEKCEREIADCKWMKIEEYMNHPNVHELNRFFVEQYLKQQQNSVKIDCKHGIHQVLKKPYTVYYADKI